MAKIVDINENDLKRIVKRVLTERRVLNENTLGKGEVDETILGNFKNAISSGKGPWDKLREVVIEKGIVSDATKLKKNEILKLLGDE